MALRIACTSEMLSMLRLSLYEPGVTESILMKSMPQEAYRSMMELMYSWAPGLVKSILYR
jgi:hypothetical protein